uniref:Hemolin n=1 Tax=Ectropis obliqua TaxID=248899 RepID=A0A0B5JK89_ECTOB|nr:hemolin [Ectropis obliqua]
MAFKGYLVLAGVVVLCAAQPVHQSLPVLKEQPLEVLFKDTQGVLECVVEGGNKNVKYSWLKNGKPLSLSSDVTQRKNEGTLEFRKPTAADEGSYQCSAETEHGVATARPISFRRAYLKPVPKPKVQEHKAVEGRPFKLDCAAPEGYPKPVVSWKTLIDGSNKPEDYLERRVTPSPDGTLWFSNVTDEDANPKMKYICVANSLALDHEVVLAEHYIKEMVKDTKPNNGDLVPQYLSNDIMAKATDVTMIWCIYGGTPLAHPDWFKDGKDVNGKPSDRITRHNRTSGRRLLIKSTILEDEGTYKCVANNEVGKPQEHSIRLTVVSAPFMALKPTQRVLRKTGEDAYIPCKFIGKPEPRVTYTFNGKPLTTSDRVTTNADGITIKNAQKADNGYYGCRAVNDHGEQYAESLFYVN